MQTTTLITRLARAVFAALPVLLMLTQVLASDAAASAAGLVVVRSDTHSVTLRLATPAPTLVDGKVRLNGLAATSDPATGLPLVLAPIRLPAPITPTLTISGDAPVPMVGTTVAGRPLPAARVLRLLVLRDVAVAVIALAPLAWDGSHLTHRPILTVDVSFAESPEVASVPDTVSPLGALLDRVALNSVEPVVEPLRPSVAASPAPHAAAATPSDLRVVAPGSGIMTISGAQLHKAGWPLDTILMSAVQLWRRGTRLPFETSAGAFDTLSAETTIRVRVPPGLSRYTDAIGFRLSVDLTAQALHEPADPTLPFVFGDLTRYSSAYAGPALDGAPSDYFYVAGLSATQPVASVPFTLPASLAAGETLQVGLQASAVGAVSAVSLALDGQPLTTLLWSGTAPQIISATVASELAAGPHTLEARLLRGGPVLIDQGLVPAVRVPLAEHTAIVAPATPTLAQQPDPQISGADLVVVTHPLFRAAIEPLIALHQKAGRRVAVVEPQAAYDAYSDGEVDPQAIRAFLRDAAPLAVLLVGDATWDFKNHLSLAGRTFVPPYLEQIDGVLGEASCDTCYVRWSTPLPAQDLMPDALIGRLSVETPAEAQVVVQKIVSYATNPPPGGWRGTHLMLTDNVYERDGRPDKTVEEGLPTFDDSAAAAVAQLPVDQRVFSFAFDPRPQQAGQPGRFGDALALRSELFSAWNSGAALVHYIGHSNYFQWGVTDSTAGVPYLYSIYDAANLTNGGRLPVLLSMSCLNGLFQEPSRPTTDEGLLRSAQGGIVAAISSSGLGVAHGHDPLHKGLLQSISQRHEPLGTALLNGFATVLTEAGCCDDLTFTYQLLGDPLLTVVSGAADPLTPVVTVTPPAPTATAVPRTERRNIYLSFVGRERR